jgi:hypothetical protein
MGHWCLFTLIYTPITSPHTLFDTRRCLFFYHSRGFHIPVFLPDDKPGLGVITALCDSLMELPLLAAPAERRGRIFRDISSLLTNTGNRCHRDIYCMLRILNCTRPRCTSTLSTRTCTTCPTATTLRGSCTKRFAISET